MKQETIAVKGAREHNLKNVSLEIPRDRFIVVTGLSGSGKSSLAFDTIYAEGQRRFLESLDSYSRKFTAQLKKPDVDFVFGLSPVISIQQKTVSRNPRSTIGTMTDIYDFLRLLYATCGQGHCPYCGEAVPSRTSVQMLEKMLTLPDGTAVEVCVPFLKIHGEDYAYLFGEIRSKGCRKIYVDGVPHDLSDPIDLDSPSDADVVLEKSREPLSLGEGLGRGACASSGARPAYRIEGVIERVVVGRGTRAIEKALLQSLENAARVGEGFVHLRVVDAEAHGVDLDEFRADFACAEHGVTMAELLPYYFSFNDPDSWCATCLGIGVYWTVHPDYLVPDRSRSIRGGAFLPEAFRYDKNVWASQLLYSLSKHYDFDLDTPIDQLPKEALDALFYGTAGERFPLIAPPGAETRYHPAGTLVRFDGMITDIDRRYRYYRKTGLSDGRMEEYIKKAMVESVCPDCHGAKVKPQRLLVKLADRSIFELGQLPLDELYDRLSTLRITGGDTDAGQQVLQQIVTRLGLLLDIGLDYLSLNRKAGTLSGGESQRIRLSTQISSGLMGMLYVLDEPSIGLHPKDNIKLIGTLKRLRDIGNTVIVVEHDEETIRSADHIIEMGPGPGIHGGELVAQGAIDDILSSPHSLTGRYLSGRAEIALPEQRRPAPQEWLTVHGARENNLRCLDVAFPIGRFVCITGASGSGKSTLINDILYKRLQATFHDSRVRYGAHDAITGIEHITGVVSIDQSPLGRMQSSIPATYVGIMDEIRRLFAAHPDALERGFTATRFSFNVRGGRCERCGGEGVLTTKLHFMADVESACPECKGTRYNVETREVKYRGKDIGEVLALSIEEAAEFFADRRGIRHKLGVLNQLGLGYITLGQSATTLSGGEAQRVKLGYELGKIKRGGRTFYILDEPTTGLHLADIQRLLDSLQRLVDAGNTVVVIEHHLDVIKCADHVIDLGPEGGRNGGSIVAAGTPEEIAAHPTSYTGHFLKASLRKHEAVVAGS